MRKNGNVLQKRKVLTQHMAVMHGWNCMYKHEHTRNEWFESTTRLLTSMFLGVECFEVPYINIIFKLFAAVFQPET